MAKNFLIDIEYLIDSKPTKALIMIIGIKKFIFLFKNIFGKEEIKITYINGANENRFSNK